LAVLEHQAQAALELPGQKNQGTRRPPVHAAATETQKQMDFFE
jgi:hypothetical protein